MHAKLSSDEVPLDFQWLMSQISMKLSYTWWRFDVLSLREYRIVLMNVAETFISVSIFPSNKTFSICSSNNTGKKTTNSILACLTIFFFFLFCYLRFEMFREGQIMFSIYLYTFRETGESQFGMKQKCLWGLKAITWHARARLDLYPLLSLIPNE